MTTFDRRREALARGGFLAALALLALKEPLPYAVIEIARAATRLAETMLVYVGPANLFY